MDNPFGLQRYGTADLESLMDRISRNSIGLDTYFENIFNVTNQVNYPPYNIVHVNNVAVSYTHLTLPTKRIV